MKIFIAILFGVLLLSSCEEQMVMIPDFQEIDPEDTTQTVKKVVLIEELTGASCPNCPAGSAAIESILTVFGDRVVANAIHGKFLAQPTSKSIYDFRNQDAEDLENALQPFLGKPAAVFDRVHFDGQDFMTVDNIGLWQSFVQQRLNESALVKIDITSTYDNTSRIANIGVNVEAIDDITGNLKLHALITESKMIDAQSNQGEIIDSYEHNHVMRKMLSNVQGDLFASGMAKGEAKSKSFTYTVPAQNVGEWIPENMEIVVYMTSSDLDDTVIQAAGYHLK